MANRIPTVESYDRAKVALAPLNLRLMSLLLIHYTWNPHDPNSYDETSS